MMSGVGVVEADSSNVLTPAIIGAGAALVHWKLNPNSSEAMTAVGVNAITKLGEAPAAMLTGVFGDPVTALVDGLVV